MRLPFFKSKTRNNSNEYIDASLSGYANRIIYKKLTSEIIDSMKDSELEQAVFDNLSIHFETDYKDEYDMVKRMSKGQQAIYTTFLVESEVNNGGFNQFYFNSSGIFAEMAIGGFQLIGAEKFANIMIEANRIYTENKEVLQAYDDGTVNSFCESYKDNPLNELDEQFYNLYKEENLQELKVIYIRKNITDFI